MIEHQPFALSPEVLRWARERVNLSVDTLAQKMNIKPASVEGWERNGKISIRQTEKLAKIAYAPLGCLYLPEPVEDKLPITDFRTMSGKQQKKPSPELLSVVYAMQRRQSWMCDDLRELGYEKLSFVASMKDEKNPAKIAAAMRETLGLPQGWAKQQSNWQNALRTLRHMVEKTGILIFINGVVGNNTRRKLNPEEFRGFALVDDYAPLIFINAADYHSAQMFTVAHELAHLWRGQQGVSNYLARDGRHNKEERLCNQIAAEFLIPQEEMRDYWDKSKRAANNVAAMSSRFRASYIAVAIRALEMGLLGDADFRKWCEQWHSGEQKRAADKVKNKGGNFWNTQNVRIGARFGLAVLRAVREGRLLYREAYSLIDLRGKTFDSYEQRLEQYL